MRVLEVGSGLRILAAAVASAAAAVQVVGVEKSSEQIANGCHSEERSGEESRFR